MSITRPVEDHYTHGDLVDEFHARGRDATIELGNALGLFPGMEVLDIGSGLGGAARRLASTTGATITGVDLTAEYCAVAAMLSERVGLSAGQCP